MFEDLRDFLKSLEERGMLIKLKDELSAEFEAAAAIRSADKLGKAILIEKIKGHHVPVAANILCRRQFLAHAMGIDGDVTEEYIRRCQEKIKPKAVSSAPFKEVVIKDKINLAGAMPLLTHHALDAGPYISCGVAVSKDPETGLRGMGIYRIQVRSKDEISIYIASPPLSDFLKKAEERGQPLPIAIAIGLEPLNYISSVAVAPPGADKFEIAGALRKRPVELARCETVDLEVYAEAEFIIEGHVQPRARVKDGPFGESTGYYLTTQSPLVKLTAVCHRKSPIYLALVPFCEENTLLMGITREADILGKLRDKFPSVRKFHLTPRSVGTIAIIQAEKRSEAEARAILEEVLANNIMVKTAILVDSDVDPYDIGEIQWALCTRFQPKSDILIKEGLPAWTIDPSATEGGLTSKLGIDATAPLSRKEAFERIEIPAGAAARGEAAVARALQG